MIFTYLNNKWHNMNIMFEYSKFIKTAEEKKLDSKIINLIVNNAFYIIKDYLYVSFFVNSDSDIKIGKIKYDLVLFIELYEDLNLNFSKTEILGIDENTKRPNKGRINININYIKQFNKDLLFFNLFYSIINEIFIVMGFNHDTLTNLKKKLSFNKKSNKYILKSPIILNKIKKNNKCHNYDFIFIKLLNKKIYLDSNQFQENIWTKETYLESRITDINFAFMEDLGWYQVNYNLAQKIIYNSNKICNIKNIWLKKNNKKKKNSSCNYKYNSIINKYKINDINNYCSLNSKDETSCIKTFENSKSDYNCLKSKCVFKNKKLHIEFSFLNNKLICSENNQILKNNDNSIKCPNLEKFCEFKFECKNNCNGHGICINGQCLCDNNFKGIACEFENKKIINSFKLNKKCNFNGYFHNEKCNCYENYNGKSCENIIIDLGSYGSNCKNSKYIKCYTGEYYNYINKYNFSNHNFEKHKINNQNNNQIILTKKPKNTVDHISNWVNSLDKKKLKELVIKIYSELKENANIKELIEELKKNN